jgi:hypothetical protein
MPIEAVEIDYASCSSQPLLSRERMAPTNKCLAESNKSQMRGTANKRRRHPQCAVSNRCGPHGTSCRLAMKAHRPGGKPHRLSKKCRLELLPPPSHRVQCINIICRAMKNRTCWGCGENFIPRAKAKHCSHECRRKGYLAGWENPERRRIQSLETRERWSHPEKRKRIVTSMRAAQQARRAAIKHVASLSALILRQGSEPTGELTPIPPKWLRPEHFQQLPR